ncbi:V-type proton ATPase subunit C-like isoform X2 [Drosophila obscura]|uniref:V-type proton ATPase subunit C-like isoform X2 n=1 Tax=Drosophila obscura TaxID=7282 RepID=UPI001BB1C31E|nr:V-type proton ATPase subunit C-like isoform X2 [Drosophila obscura]
MDTGPGPPDDSMPCRHHQRIKNLSLRHQRKHQHTHHQNKSQHYHLQHHHQLPQDIKGKSTSTTTTTNQLCPSRDPSQAPSTPTLPAAAAIVPCACNTTTPVPGSGSGGSLNNLSTTHDESERDFDFVIPPQPGGCLCEECGVFAPPSTSVTASTLVADECYSHTASSMLSATRSALSTMAAIATGSSLAGGSSVGGASTSAAAAAAHAHGHGHPPAAAAASAPAKNSSASTLCSSAYFSTSAPTTSSSVHSMSRSNSKKLNNNTCSINHNKPSFRSGSHSQQRQNLSSSSPLQSPTQKSCDSSDVDAEGDGDTTDGDPKSPNSARSSDLSETFDWWFNKPKRNSKKSSAHQCEHHQQQQQQQQHQHPQQLQQSKAMTFWHQASTTPRSSYRSFFNSLADQIYSKRSSSSQLNINNGFNLTPTHRSSPVSSCCGSSSQGRSSPDTDNPEPPVFPLSPVYALPKQCCCR